VKDIAYSKPELLDQLKEHFHNFAEGTLGNPLLALINTFDKSPLGNKMEIGKVSKVGNIRYITKIGSDNISPYTIGYLLYKIAKKKKCYELTVSDFYGNGEIGPYELFGISIDYFLNCLRYLQEQSKGMIKIDLLGGLENIHLCDDYNELSIIELIN
jgi:hypothetical protein